MSAVRFEICTEKTVDKLLEFIDVHWQKDHILVRSRKLFDWQHKADNGEYNFALAISNETDEICAIQGFIPAGHFSSNLEGNNEAWGALWKRRDDIETPPGIGHGLLVFLLKKYKTYCSIALSEMVLPYYAALKWEVGVLKHHVLVNKDSEKFTIFQPGEWQQTEVNYPLTGYKLIEQTIKSISKLEIDAENGIFIAKPKKDVEFLINRYMKHPFYKYKVYAVSKDEITLGFLVTRHISAENSTIIRIIDYQGGFDHFSRLHNPLMDLLKNYNAEYIDFMQFGIPTTNLENAGFVDVHGHQGMVVPDWFEPFVSKNIVLDFAYKTEKSDQFFFICKGDGDQDRPNDIGAHNE